VILDTVLSIKTPLISYDHFMIPNNYFISLRYFMMTNTRHLFSGLWKMEFISARLTQLSTQRAIRGFVALLVTSVTFWCLTSGDDGLQNSSSHHSEAGNLATRGTVKIQTPGAIAGLVVGIILGVLTIGVIVWLFNRANLKLIARAGYQGSGITVEHRWQFKGDRPRELNRLFFDAASKPRIYLRDGGESDSVTNFPAIDTQGAWKTIPIREQLIVAGPVGPPMQFWKPTEMERDLASRISLGEGPSLAIPTSAKQAPLKSSEYDPVLKLSSPDLESKILLPESVTPVLGF
jgi:hypothetical protein